MDKKRAERLMPGEIPKYVRCYDNGGNSADRYTVVFTGKYPGKKPRECNYRAMSSNPFHPQGVGLFCWNEDMIDTNNSGFAPAVGRKNHLGTRIPFSDLTEECQKLIISDYKEIWGI